MNNINTAPQRPVKCFHNLTKEFDLNLFQCKTWFLKSDLHCISESENQKTAETLVRTCSIKLNCKEHALYGILHRPQSHVHTCDCDILLVVLMLWLPVVVLMLWLSVVVLMLWLSAQPEKIINL